MPLRDYFRPPVNLHHAWDELHGGWPMKIVETLAADLPAQFTPAPRVHLGSAVEIDVGAYEHYRAADSNDSHGTPDSATATWTATKPSLRVETDIPDVDEY